MPAQGFTLFDTAIGACGIAWGVQGIVGVQLPEHDATATHDRLQRRYPGASEAPPPPNVRQTIDAVIALLRGEACDLSAAALDMRGVSRFHQQIYAVARGIPPGATLSYGEIATRLGDRGAARTVGEAMARNPFPIIVPCHRVLAANGKMGGFSATGGVATKLRLLNIERARIGGAMALFDTLPLSVRPPQR
jgi:methylated-DNA-[protein]-cysteine S-methyltransferase